MKKIQTEHSKGFTMVEMAIVLIFIGLIIAGVIGGRSLVRNSQLLSVSDDLTKYRTAVTLFEDQYAAFPGDMLDAYSVFDVDATNNICGTNALAPAGCNGNGNNVINNGGEDVRSWQHLSLAGILQGRLSGALVDGNFVPGTNVPQSKIDGGGYWLHTNTLFGRTDNSIAFASGGGLNEEILTTREAWSIDAKIDDGVANTGDVMSVDGVAGCVNTAGPGTINDYRLTTTNTSCIMVFWINAPN